MLKNFLQGDMCDFEAFQEKLVALTISLTFELKLKFGVWFLLQSAQLVTISLMSLKVIAAAKDSWACLVLF